MALKTENRRKMPSAALACLLLAWCAGYAVADEITVKVLDDKGAPVQNAAVYAYPADGKPPAPEVKAVTVDQADKEFLPELTVVPVNTPIIFPNSDKIRHHVYSLSKAKSFELPLYIGTPSKPVVFDKPGVVALGCNIHDWMIAYIYIVDTPYYAKTDSAGMAKIEGLAGGTYTIEVWHPRMKNEPRDTLTSASTGGAPVVIGIKVRPVWRPRRAPVSGGGGY